jgi:hypothetical protein
MGYGNSIGKAEITRTQRSRRKVAQRTKQAKGREKYEDMVRILNEALYGREK